MYHHSTIHPSFIVLTIKFYMFLIICKLTFCDHMRVCDDYYKVGWFPLHNLAVCFIISVLMIIGKVKETCW